MKTIIATANLLGIVALSLFALVLIIVYYAAIAAIPALVILWLSNQLHQ